VSCALAPATQRRQVLTSEGAVTATTPGSRLPDRPVTGSVVEAGASASPIPLRALDAVLPPGATAPSAGRAHARAFARECDRFSAQTAETGELLVSEMVTNAFQAACGTVPGPSGPGREPAVRLSLRSFPGELLIEVIDRSPDTPVSPSTGHESEHGRGLMLIDALSREWGWFPVPGGGKCVYCRLATET
jgi:anti-sigma regulatory factor (Ser/Thr protein kinase)